MPKSIKQSSHDEELSDLLKDIHDGKIQLPEFQRGWIWDDQRICAIIASLSQSYPMGVITLMNYKATSLKFGYRQLNGVEHKGKSVDYLILDGQQRLTSIYCAIRSSKPVKIPASKGKELRCFYYLDINKCLDEKVDRIKAVISVPEGKVKTKFGGEVQLDLSTREHEYEREMFPLNILFESSQLYKWGDGYKKYHHYSDEYSEKYNRFLSEILETITSYKLPVIRIEEATKEAVCKVFENINKGGITLTIFELLTASFAADDFNLRDDWEKCRKAIRGRNTDILDGVDEVSFLTAVTLYTTYMKSGTATACGKPDVLELALNDYKQSRDALLKGYNRARMFLFQQGIFRQRDIPYPAQIVPLAAICAVLDDHQFNNAETTTILSKWFWCGIFGEDYSNTNYVNDIEDVLNSINRRPSQNRTVNAALFNPARLLTMRTRQSAAYKGVMALLYKTGCMDIVSGTIMDVAKSMDLVPDIHHIFPSKYCKAMNYLKDKYDSIINKTPLLAASNRTIGGAAPSVYSAKILKKASIDNAELRKRLETNLIDYDLFVADDFEAFFADRARKLLELIAKAMGKPLTAELPSLA